VHSAQDIEGGVLIPGTVGIETQFGGWAQPGAGGSDPACVDIRLDRAHFEFDGLVAGLIRIVRRLLDRVLQFVVSIPTVSFAVLSLIVLGISPMGPILNTMIVATPYITTNLAQGLTGVDRRLIVMSESFGRTRAQIIVGVLIPSSLLSILGGARLAFAVAWRVALLTEIFASADGIGLQIRRSFESYDIQGMLAWALLFIVIMLLIENLVLRQVERRLSRWRTPATGVAP